MRQQNYRAVCQPGGSSASRARQVVVAETAKIWALLRLASRVRSKSRIRNTDPPRGHIAPDPRDSELGLPRLMITIQLIVFRGGSQSYHQSKPSGLNHLLRCRDDYDTGRVWSWLLRILHSFQVSLPREVSPSALPSSSVTHFSPHSFPESLDLTISAESSYRVLC